ncbi:amidohydrolase [Chitinophaga silvatica]|uniref:Amidohydrolase n=1 Tax=Chitinophaga silvatica TaxID=2282649 RepID=A0A3E1Y9S5_9BACT|nr:amidohydrolase family protein [Chitinophaga silvatica]RFS22473.1 amidohydrolase [Chitinophaga silvatica]
MKQIKLKGKDIFNGVKFLGSENVLITDQTGIIIDILPTSKAGNDVQEVDGILCPGFINTHCHLELSHMKGQIPEHTGLPAFLTKVMETRNQPADLAEKIDAAEQAMWESGIVAVGDICNTTNTLVKKQQERMYYHSFVECMGVADMAATQRYDYSMGVLNSFQEIVGPFNKCSIVPHAPYSVSKTLFNLLASTPDNIPVSIHNQETAAENELFQQKSGAFIDFYNHFKMNADSFQPSNTNSLEAFLPYFNNQKIILVHNTFTTEADATFAQRQLTDVWWCLCPNANLYIENRLPDIQMLRKLNCNITLGTDSLASNHQLSIWEEISTIRSHYPEIPLAEILQWATYNGAKALGIQDNYGTFKVGSQPGIILINEKSKRII